MEVASQTSRPARTWTFRSGVIPARRVLILGLTRGITPAPPPPRCDCLVPAFEKISSQPSSYPVYHHARIEILATGSPAGPRPAATYVGLRVILIAGYAVPSQLAALCTSAGDCQVHVPKLLPRERGWKSES